MHLTDKQRDALETVLLSVTDDTFKVLENIFGLNITSSDSSIEIIAARENGNVERLGSDALYTISSHLDGDLQAQMLVLLRSVDFSLMSRLLKPMLKSLYEVRPEAAAVEAPRSPRQSAPESRPDSADTVVFNDQMMEALAEMANMLCGVYTRAIYKVCELNSNHSVPEACIDYQQRAIKQMLAQSRGEDAAVLVIENEFFILDNPVKLWCLIAPDEASHEKLLRTLEQSTAAEANPFSIARAAQQEE